MDKLDIPRKEIYTQSKLRKKMVRLFNEIEDELSTIEARVTTLERTTVSQRDLERLKRDVIKKIKQL